MIVKLISSFFILTILSGCSRNNDDTEALLSVEKNFYTFKYANAYKLNEIVLFKGPKGDKENPQEGFIKNVWDSYATPEYDQVDLDIKSKLIKLHLGKKILENPIRFSNDSIFISPENSFIGTVNQNKYKLQLYKSFNYVKKDLENSALSFSRFTKLGEMEPQKIFGANTFLNPSEMKSVHDEVFWANISYSFEQK